MNKLEKLKNQLLESNSKMSEKLKELDKATDHCVYSKEHYETVMNLCKESLKIIGETKTASDNIEEYLESLDLDFPECLMSDLLKRKLIDHLAEGPELFESAENTVLDLMNMYKDKFTKKQAELLSLDSYHRIFMFYTRQADPSIMEMTF